MPQRNSNTELLRLVCMLMIVLHHLISHGAFSHVLHLANTPPISSSIEYFALYLNGFVFIGVNCFVLISGYYGIRFKLKSLVRLYLLCSFYWLLGYAFHACIVHEQNTTLILHKIIYAVFLPLSHNSWWFIRCYVALLFLAPLLNYAVNGMGKSTYLKALAALTILNVYGGWLWGDNIMNQEGYSVAQFVYIYFIGGYLRRYVSLSSIQRRRYLWLAEYIVCSLVWGTLTLLSTRISLPFWRDYYYHNPLILLSAVSFFLFSLTWKIQSKGVNWLATGTLAVYLFHSDGFVGQHLYSWTAQMSNKILAHYSPAAGGVLDMLFLAGTALGLVIGICLMDHVREWLMRPIWKLYYRLTARLRANGIPVE